MEVAKAVVESLQGFGSIFDRFRQVVVLTIGVEEIDIVVSFLLCFGDTGHESHAQICRPERSDLSSFH